MSAAAIALVGPAPLARAVADTTAPVTTANAVSQTRATTDNWSRGAWTVTLSCSDEGTGCAATEFEVDGRGWFPLADRQFFLVAGEGRHVARYRSQDNAGNREADQKIFLGEDDTPPQSEVRPAASLPAHQGWTRGRWTVAVECSDPLAGDPTGASGCASTYSAVDIGPMFVYSSPVTIDEEGLHSFGFYSVDRAGNAQGSSDNVDLGVDRHAPTAQVAVNDLAVVAPGDSIAINAQDPTPAGVYGSSGVRAACLQATRIRHNGHVMITVGKEHTECFPATFRDGFWYANPKLRPGRYDFAARATDVAGNVGVLGPAVRVIVL